MRDWTKFFRASAVLAQEDDVQKLYEIIVEQVRDLGYPRARLYEYAAKENLLLGRASVGLSPDNAERFSRLVFQLNDKRYKESSIQGETPYLCISGRPGSSAHE